VSNRGLMDMQHRLSGGVQSERAVHRFGAANQLPDLGQVSVVESGGPSDALTSGGIKQERVKSFCERGMEGETPCLTER